MKPLQILSLNAHGMFVRLFLFLVLLFPVAWAQTVATPTFLPVSGTSLTKFPVIVSCATSGATIRYTVTGAEPTIYDPVVVSGQSVVVKQNMTLKAKAFNGANTSTTAATTFDLTGDVSGGSQFLLALVSNGQVYGWGNQDFGRLSNNSTATTNVLAPAFAKYSAAANINDATRIAAGAKHSILLDAAGNVWGFGNNLLGESGRSTPSELLYAAKVTSNSAGTTFLTVCTKVAAGLDFSAALESGGWVDTWGNQANGRLGNGSTAAGSRKFSGRVKSSSTVDLAGIRDIALGKDFALAREACALELGGALGKVWVWGNNASANLGIGNTTAQSYATKAKLNATTDLTDVWDVDAGDDFTAVVRWKTGDTNLQGSVWTFGNRVNSSLGDNGATTGTASYPVQVQKLVGTVYSPLTGIQQISCGPKHTLALDNLGNVWAWGNNATGALGDNSTVTKKYAVKVRNPANTGDLSNIARVSAGGINGSPAFSTAVARDGTIYVWGSNANGLLANGTTSTTVFAKLPVVIAQLKTIPGFPTVTLSATVTAANAPGAATLTATVTDPQGAGTIAKTEFYVQGVLHTTKTAAPWTASLTGLAQGSYSAYAKTTDADGNETTSLATNFTIAANPDSDGDGLLDSWEITHFGSITAQTGAGDADNDKISNLNEFTAGTNPNSNNDANADGIPDDWVTWHLAQPTGVPVASLSASGDPDQDEITNLTEFTNGTNPRLLDSDADGQSDWQEAAQGTNPNNVNSLVYPLEVSAHQGTLNLHISQTLLNLTPANSYNLNLSGNIPLTSAYELQSSNVAGGPAYEWIDIKTTGGNLTAFKTDQYGVVQRPIGFTFPFYGASYTNLFITGQGYLTLVDPSGGFPHDFRAPLPNSAGSRALIAPYEQYLEPNVLGDVYFKSFATYTVVQWEQVKIFGFDSRPTFQVVIYSDGSIRFNYKSIHLTSSGLYVSGYLSGIQNAAGDDGIGASWYTSSQQGLALHGLAPVSLRFAAPATTPPPWVTATATTTSGNPLSWEFIVQASGLQPGGHQALLELRKSGGPVLYSRPLNLTVLPQGTSGNDVMLGTSGDDSISGHAGNDTLSGLDGNDTLNGGSGNDTLTGNSGNDSLSGSDGKDVYHYALGDGNDTYTDFAGIHQADDATADYSDLYFGAGITPASIKTSYMDSLGQMKFEIIAPTPGSITITSWNIYSVSTNIFTSRRWRFHFQDGTVWSGQLFWNDDLSWPFEGFTGGTQNDSLTGSEENEGLRGLQGDDFLQGGAGWDSYSYQWGDGNDTIQDDPGYGEISSLAIYGANLENQLTYDFVAPYHLRINVSHPADLSKNGSILLRDWFRTEPFLSRENWRIHVIGATGEYVDISSRLRFMGTNGPDVVQLAYIHNSDGQSFSAGAGNDTITGSNYGETINGGSGNDLLSGGTGVDIINGGDDDDTLSGGEGNDTLDGGNGNDIINGNTGADTLLGADGNDTLLGEDGDDILDGGAGNDLLDGGFGVDTLKGGSGDDDLRGGYGSDTYQWNLGDGHDTISDSTSDTAVNIENRLVFGAGILPSQVILEPGAAASLKFSVRNSGNTEIGSVIVKNWFTATAGGGNHASNWRISFADVAMIWDGNSLVTPGDDRITGTSGNDILQGGLGNDTIHGLDLDDSLLGQEGNDTLNGGNGADTLDGGDGNDSLDGGAGEDSLDGGAGNDFLRGGSGSDTYFWQVGDGNDTFEELWPQGASDVNVISFSGEVGLGIPIGRQFVKVTVIGYTDADFTVISPNGGILAVLRVKNWHNTKSNWRVKFPDDVVPFDWQLLAMIGTPQADNISGGIYNDEIKGLEDDDYLSGLGGDDIIDGADGNDTILGGDGNDTLTGGDGNDAMFGDAGDDRLEGGNGNDGLTGGLGNDVLIGGAGDDLMQGGEGEDRYIWVPGDGNDTIIEILNTTQTNHLIFGQEVLPSSIRLVPAGQNLRFEVLAADVVVGSVTINGWYGPTQVQFKWSIEFANGEVWNRSTLATPGNDVFTGGSGNDIITGGGGDDSLSGGDGNDVLEGNAGNDTLNGGSGSNEYIYHVGDGNDQINPNMAPGLQKDRLNLHSILRYGVSIEILSTNPLEVRITILSTGERILIHGGNSVLIEFSDTVVEFNASGVDLRLGAVIVRSGWKDSDGDTFPDDVEIALNAFSSAAADAQNAVIFPAADAVADASITVASGNRYPTLTAALAAAEASRAARPYVVVKVEPGSYAEDLNLNMQGVFIQGPGSAGRATILRKNRYEAPSLNGAKMIFDGLCFGKSTSSLGLQLNATEFTDGIRFTNCLFLDQVLAFQALTPSPVKVNRGDVSFIHCTFFKLAGMNVTADANVTFLNSLVDTIPSAIWTGIAQIRSFSSLLDFNRSAVSPGFGVRSDGLLKVIYPGRTSLALDHVAAADRLLNWRDLDGEPRDSASDIGCDEYVDSDNAGSGDQLPDLWELNWFGNLTGQSGSGDADSDGKTNLVEYDAETNPMDPYASAGPLALIDLSSAVTYGTQNILGANPLPDAAAANWLPTCDGKVTFSGRQGSLEYKFDLVQATMAALFFDATFKRISGAGSTSGSARIYLDGQWVREIEGSLSNVMVPLYLIPAGQHVVRLELINSQRDYRPVINSIAVRPLGSQYDASAASAAVAMAVNRIITLPAESLVSPAFVEGESVAKGSVALTIPIQNTGVEIKAAYDRVWYANVPLEASPENTGVRLSFGNDQVVEQHQIRWKPTMLEQVPALVVRKGDALRLHALAAGASTGDVVSYSSGSQQIGSAVLGAALPYTFASAGTFIVTAKVGGQPVSGAQTVVTVVEASFSTSLTAAKSNTATLQLPLVSAGLAVQGSSSLKLVRSGTSISITPAFNGPQGVVARIDAGGPIVATGEVNVFSVAGTGYNGGGRVLSVLPDGRKLMNMSYSVDGAIPANLRVKITVWVGGSLFTNGTNTIWLTKDDFDEFGVANVQVFTSGAICQSLQLFLAE